MTLNCKRHPGKAPPALVPTSVSGWIAPVILAAAASIIVAGAFLLQALVRTGHVLSDAATRN